MVPLGSRAQELLHLCCHSEVDGFRLSWWLHTGLVSLQCARLYSLPPAVDAGEQPLSKVFSGTAVVATLIRSPSLPLARGPAMSSKREGDRSPFPEQGPSPLCLQDAVLRPVLRVIRPATLQSSSNCSNAAFRIATVRRSRPSSVAMLTDEAHSRRVSRWP